MIWDTFLFHNELDLLECRLTELQDCVDRFVLVEAPVTFQGRPKPLYYGENKKRFAAWEDKIVHVVADNLPDGGIGIRECAWGREGVQRENIFRGLGDASPDDLILLGDVDEIPRAHMIGPQMWPGVTLVFSYHVFAVDWLHPEPWPGTMVQRLNGISSFCQVRDMRRGWPRVPDAGWHFSFLGGCEAVHEKVNAYSHVEYRDDMPRWMNAHGGRMALDADTMTHLVGQRATRVDDSFPRWIREGKCPASWFRPEED
jgi:beta-1,4-mannosyl-glycoprotein beta-1,4-N-acetylglucosaminyltransferase